MLGEAIVKAISRIHYTGAVPITSSRQFLQLPRRPLPSVEHARAAVNAAKTRLEQMRAAGAPRQQIRTAEVDWFGADAALTLARAAAGQQLHEAIESCLPAEIQALTIGPWTFVGWPGEIFVEYALAVKAQTKDAYLISLANGYLQGYIVTHEAAEEGAYEATNALFAPESGALLVSKTLAMLADGRRADLGEKAGAISN